jgi:hypothetical protein
MKTPHQVLAGMGLGAWLMYDLDPNRGARRRGMLRDQLVHSAIGPEGS